MKLLLHNFIKGKKKDVKKRTLVSSLAPKILTKKEDIEKIQSYLDKLNETIDTKGINNIALTGGYGSGKSTIIGTFKELNPQYKFLNISLASFNKKKSDDKLTLAEQKLQKEELERLLEVSILQQIFYHVKPDEIPESRFKRIINIPDWKIWGISIGFILWVSSSVLLLKYDYLDKINPNNWNVKDSFDWFALFIFIIAFIGLGLFSKLIIKLFSNSKINKVNIKGELELGDNVNKSVFNEHLEEILYFFERTEYDVVLIEDLDRFDSTDIFTKLREINILLNNSKLINREINFVYAVGDDLFNDKKERVKFFEYIIPVIPFINSSNAEEQLKTLIKESELGEDIFPKEFISDITTFIDDIDMRLLINIFHEFAIYRNVLKPDLIRGSEAELFSMITYKNLDPKDYDALNSKKGKLYNLLNNKKLYTKELIEKIDEKIVLKEEEIENINNENITDIKELRKIYINQILTKLPQSPIYFSALKIDKLVKDDEFEKLIEDQSMSYQWHHQHSYNSQQSTLSFNFEKIEKEVNPNFTYEERVNLVENKHNNRVDVLQKEIEKLKKKKSEIEKWDLSHIFKEVGINQYLNDFTNSGLLRNLLLEGYINENYNDYISLFHEVSLTKDDKRFERSVKSGVNENFDYKLTHIENLVNNHLDLKYFERETILNFDLLDYLGNNYNRYSNKYDSIIRVLSNEKERSIDFISEYTKEIKRPIWIFIEKLVENWKGFLDFIYLNSAYRNVEDKYLELIIRFSKVETIINNQNTVTLKNVIENTPYFLSLIKNTDDLDYYGKIAKILKKLDVKFKKLDSPNEDSDKLFDYVYDNNHYKINKDNLLQMLLIFGKKNIEGEFKRSNYSTILKSDCKPLIEYIDSNITAYVENVYLKLEDNKFEEEETLLKLLNNKHLENKSKIKIIQRIDTKISDLKKIKELEIKEQLLINNKVAPNWNNIIDYYTVSENIINENLIVFLEFEDVNTELSKVKLLKENKVFEGSLLVCKDISDETYKKIIDSVYFRYNQLDFENLNEEKVIYLVDKILTTTKSNYDILREDFPNNHITLIEKDFNKFFEKVDDFKTDEGDILMILQSKDISIDNRFKYIAKLSEQTIIDNKAVAKKVGEIIISKSSKIEFDFNTIKSIVRSLDSNENKVKLVNLYFNELTNQNIISIVKIIGHYYSELFEKQHKPLFNDNFYNRELLTKLKSKNLISSFDADKKDNTKIRAVANY